MSLSAIVKAISYIGTMIFGHFAAFFDIKPAHGMHPARLSSGYRGQAISRNGIQYIFDLD